MGKVLACLLALILVLFGFIKCTNSKEAVKLRSSNVNRCLSDAYSSSIGSLTLLDYLIDNNMIAPFDATSAHSFIANLYQNAINTCEQLKDHNG